MPFWVLENKHHQYARIHLDHCPSCNYGKGPQPDRTGCWHGPFPGYQEAMSEAKRYDWPVFNCKRCNPR